LLKPTVSTFAYKAGFPLGGIFLCLVIPRVELIRKDNEKFEKFCLVKNGLILTLAEVAPHSAAKTA
jgi:hypothetical protein